jgi:hypothetical protein
VAGRQTDHSAINPGGQCSRRVCLSVRLAFPDAHVLLLILVHEADRNGGVDRLQYETLAKPRQRI